MSAECRVQGDDTDELSVPVKQPMVCEKENLSWLETSAFMCELRKTIFEFTEHVFEMRLQQHNKPPYFAEASIGLQDDGSWANENRDNQAKSTREMKFRLLVSYFFINPYSRTIRYILILKTLQMIKICRQQWSYVFFYFMPNWSIFLAVMQQFRGE